MNINDSERIAALLKDNGMREALSPEKVDCIIINTCSVRQSAENRVFGLLQNLAELKSKNPALRIAVTGCMPGRDNDGCLKRKLPQADFFLPIRDITHLPALLEKSWLIRSRRNQQPENYLSVKPKYRSPFQAYVTIQSGCNNFCTFCVVPYARGREYSRPARDVLNEISALAAKGTLEITLLGQNVNAYKPSDAHSFSKHNPFSDPFAALLWEINQIQGIERIHFTAPNPQDMTSEVIRALALPKQVNYLHLPVQSGSDAVLARMNRRHTREHYLDIIKNVRAVRPSIAVGTDLIVGFCGETRRQFEDTLSLYRKVKFDIAYTACYSPRPGTLAAKLWKDDVPHKEKKARWLEIKCLMETIVREKNRAYKNKTLEVLVDSTEKKSKELPVKPGNKDDALLGGNSREMKRVRFFGPSSLKGAIIPVTIIKTQEWILWGKRKQ